MSIYEDDLKNRFPTYTFTETTFQDLQIVTVLDGATTLNIARALTLDECYQNLRLKMVGGAEILLSITSAQRDALPSQPDGIKIFNTDESALQVAENDIFANVAEKPVIYTVQTTDGAATTISTITMPDGDYRVDVKADAVEDDFSNAAKYESVCYFTVASSVASIDTSLEVLSAETAVGWVGIVFAVSGNDLLVQVEGHSSATINWEAYYNIEEL